MAVDIQNDSSQIIAFSTSKSFCYSLASRYFQTFTASFPNSVNQSTVTHLPFSQFSSPKSQFCLLFYKKLGHPNPITMDVLALEISLENNVNWHINLSIIAAVATKKLVIFFDLSPIILYSLYISHVRTTFALMWAIPSSHFPFFTPATRRQPDCPKPILMLFRSSLISTQEKTQCRF